MGLLCRCLQQGDLGSCFRRFPLVCPQVESPCPSRLGDHHHALQEECWLCAPQSDAALIYFGQ